MATIQKSKKKQVVKKKIIVVAGDVTIDWFRWDVQPIVEDESKDSPNWQRRAGTRMSSCEGGAALLAKFVKAANRNADVRSYHIPLLENISPKEIIHSISYLGKCKVSVDPKKDEQFVYRILESCGYCGPKGYAKPCMIENDDPDADIVILDDARNGFCREKDAWPKALTNRKNAPLIIYKINRAPLKSKLWTLLSTPQHSERVVVVIGANDLRDYGVNICRHLSWERTAETFVWHMSYNEKMKEFRNCRNLIVRLGLDGVIHYSNTDGKQLFMLYYDPNVIEDGFYETAEGRMQGMANSFVASLSKLLTIKNKGIVGFEDGIKDGILRSRRLYELGFGNDDTKFDYPCREVFKSKFPKYSSIAPPIEIPQASEQPFPTQHRWSILEHVEKEKFSGEYKTSEKKKDVGTSVLKSLEMVAFNVVAKGTDSNFKNVPVACYNKLTVVDRTEVESFRSVKNLFVNYLHDPKQNTPLSIAVFGQQGSGKSFGVEQLSESIDKDRIEKKVFNVSQFKSLQELSIALSEVQNIVLKGKLPLVFFDEFDSKFGDEELGWLKYFLMPMQDGKFMYDNLIHNVGKSIFVFAGGTKHSFEDFAPVKPQEILEVKVLEEKKLLWQKFINSKGPDFLSRLKGYIDILGPNQVNERDRMFIIRRAMILRSLIDNHLKNKIIAKNKAAKIDPSVIRAFLNVTSYKHGVRSIEAILTTSNLENTKIFGQACLPPMDQLDMHVDADVFHSWLTRSDLFGDATDWIAKHIHETYVNFEKKAKSDDDEWKKDRYRESLKPWVELNSQYKEDSRQQLDKVQILLRKKGYGIVKMREKGKKIKIIPADIVEEFAKEEHERASKAKLKNGWIWGEKKDEKKRINPFLVPWDELPDIEQTKNKITIKEIPQHLAAGGFKIIKLH